MKTRQLVRSILVGSLLTLTMIALLTVYGLAVSDLPARVYTEKQREFLEYNSMRSISQAAPTLNYVKPTGSMLPAILPWQSSRVLATLVARYEEREGVSVTVYDLDFHGEYRLAHNGTVSATVSLVFPFPDNLETLHDVRLLIDGQEPAGAVYSTRAIQWQTTLYPDEAYDIEISYRADGANSFAYSLMRDQRTDIDITVNVVGLRGSAVDQGALAASMNEPTADGERWTWRYAALIADRDIRLKLPSRLSFSQRVAQLQDSFRALAGLAPLWVALFMASLAGVFALGGVRLRPESYFLAGLGLALFYPLLTFSSGLLPLPIAAAMSGLLTGGLLFWFLTRAAAGIGAGRAVGLRVGLLLLIFVGLLSLGMLTPWRGLMLSLGGLALVGLLMMLYARQAALAEPHIMPTNEPPAPSAPANDDTPVTEAAIEPATDNVATANVAPANVAPTVPAAPEPMRPHCPYCARALEADHTFCPGCGHETGSLRRCAHCGHRQLVPAESRAVYCVQCGEQITSTNPPLY